MTDIITADLHLTDKPSDEYRWRALSNLPTRIATATDIRRIIVLGDITENKDRHSEELVNKVVALFTSWLDQLPSIIIIILAGNHCGITSDRAFFRFLSSVQRILYITSPIAHGEELFLPHTRNEHDWDDFRPFTYDKYKRIYMHQTVHGATAANSQTLEGMDASIFEDTRVKVFSGDVHTKQIVDRHIFYVGSPYPIDFGDADGGSVIVSEPLINKHKFVSLTQPIKKKKLRVDYRNYIEDLKDQENFEYPDSQFIVLVSITQSELVNWSTIKKSIQTFIESKGCHCIRVQADVAKNLSVERRRRSPLSISPSNVVKRFAEQNSLDSYFVKTALDIVKEER